MASSALQKVLRSQSHSAIRIFTQYGKPSPLLQTQIPKLSDLIDFDDPKKDDSKPSPSIFSHVYPTFSFGLFLNPDMPPSLIQLEPDDTTVPEDSRTIRADSVKKKRKKKMNKHKLRKLRKRLRRKTKT